MVYKLDEKECGLSFVDYNGKAYTAIPTAVAPKDTGNCGGGSCSCDVSINEAGNWVVNGDDTNVSARGTGFQIKKAFPSEDAMNADLGSTEEGDFVVITSDVEESENARLYVRTADAYKFITDLSGATGIQGPQGIQGEQGVPGTSGRRGDKGERGDVGPKGDPGQSAYELWRVDNPEGSQADFLASLKGDKGDNGENGAKGEKGDPLKIKKTYPSVEAMNADPELVEGDLAIIASGPGNDDNGKLFVKTGTDTNLLVDLSGAEGIKGEKGETGDVGPEGPTGPTGPRGEAGPSAYQAWLSLGNNGSVEQFLETLKGPKGDKGDVTDIGVTALEYFQANITSQTVRPTSSNREYFRLTYNTKTMWGTLHLDLTPNTDVGLNASVGSLPVGVPRPYTLIEVNAIGSGGDVGQIYIKTNGDIQANNLKRGQRYIVDLTGYYQ